MTRLIHVVESFLEPPVVCCVLLSGHYMVQHSLNGLPGAINTLMLPRRLICSCLRIWSVDIFANLKARV